MNDTPDFPDIWAETRYRWNTQDLPVLLGKVADKVVADLERKMQQRRQEDAA